MKRHIILWSIVGTLLMGGVCYAGDLASGTYLLGDGTMEMSLNINRMPDGKYFVNAQGSSRSGKTCRIGDLAELTGDKLVVGGCPIEIKITSTGVELKDSKPCAQCEPGAYISGSYKKQ